VDQLAAIVGRGFGVDEEAADLGVVDFEGAFEGGDDLVNPRHGEVVGQGAVAVDLDTVGSVVMAASDEDFVDVEDLGEGLGGSTEADFELAVAFEGVGALDGGRFAFDVGEDGGYLGDLAAHLGLELGDEGVGCAEGHGLVDLEVLLDVELVVVLLDADVVDGEVGASGDSADAVVHAFGARGDGDGVDDDVGSGEVALDGGGSGHGDLLGALEGEVARHAEGDVGEVAGAGAAGANAVDGENAVDGGEFANEVAGLRAGLHGGRVGEGVDGSTSEVPGDIEDDAGDEDGGDGVGQLECWDVPVLTGVGRGEAKEDRDGGPNVSAEVDGIGFEGFASGFGGDAVELAGAGEVDCDGEEKDDEGPDGKVEGEVLAEEDAADGFGEDPDAGGEHEDGFDGGGETFDLAVAVGVVGVGGTVGDLDGEESDAGGDEVDAGVGGLGEHAEGSGKEAGEELEKRDTEGGEDGEECGGALGAVRSRGLLGRGRLAHGRDGTGFGLSVVSSLLSE
jgi:hypothetical protein